MASMEGREKKCSNLCIDQSRNIKNDKDDYIWLLVDLFIGTNKLVTNYN